MCYQFAVSKIVIDTNVFVSALLSEDGAARAVLRMALTGEVRPLFGNALFAEYESLLSRSELWRTCPVSASDREFLLDALLACSDWLRIHFLWRPNLIDEADNHVLELAVAGGAEAVVTANARDFSRAELVFPDVVILTPGAFLKRRRQQ
jgi:putative PIN family toxin of toxin-antitoxin system